MKFPLPRPLFPNLSITPADEAEFTDLVAVFVDKLLIEEHAFRVTNNSQVDPTKWKHSKQSEHATVYHGRDSGASSSSEDGGAINRLIPFLTVGKVPDSLEDLAYSMAAPTRESMIIQAAHVDSNIPDVEVLHTIQRPTLDAPFSHLTVKWLLLAPIPALLTPRDYIVIDALGTRVHPLSGERVAYRFVHSIQVTGAGPLTDRGFIRSNMSMSTVFCEDSSNGRQVHEYARTFFAPGGVIPHSVFVAIVAASISSTSAQGRIGECKKLAMALRHKEAGKWTVAVPPPRDAAQKSDCGVCAKSLNMINKSRSDCALCARRLCTSCRVRKELFFLNAERKPEKVRVTFCALCVQQAIKLPPHVVASEEYLVRNDNFYRLPASLR